MTDLRERAIDLLERFIRQGQDNDSYPRAVAAECLAALEGLGWRPTEARPDLGGWKHRQQGSGPSEDTRALIEAAKAACDADAAVRMAGEHHQVHDRGGFAA